MLLGGRLDKASQTVTGAAAVAAVGALRVDLCVLGVCSVDASVGISCAGFEEAELEARDGAQARRGRGVVTADKLGTAAPFMIGPVDVLHRIVTETAGSRACSRPDLIGHGRAAFARLTGRTRHDRIPPDALRRARLAIGVVFLVNGAVFGSWAPQIPLVQERLGLGPGAPRRGAAGGGRRRLVRDAAGRAA